MGNIETPEAVLNSTTQLINEKYELERELAAAQAREKVAIDALRDCENQMSMADGGCANCSSYPDGKVVLCKLHEALALPTEDTALQNLIVYERLDAVRSYQTMYEKLMLPDLLKTERERVAKHFESRSYLGSGHQLAVEIRALED